MRDTFFACCFAWRKDGIWVPPGQMIRDLHLALFLSRMKYCSMTRNSNIVITLWADLQIAFFSLASALSQFEVISLRLIERRTQHKKAKFFGRGYVTLRAPTKNGRQIVTGVPCSYNWWVILCLSSQVLLGCLHPSINKLLAKYDEEKDGPFIEYYFKEIKTCAIPTSFHCFGFCWIVLYRVDDTYQTR